ncbi:MAG: heavy metal-binding domain-containing protein [Veillonella sp.]|nr:heavy metal-binding domain-containing protein [Veillonella sp.]
MIITTTMHIENKPVQEYKGIVLGANAIIGVSFQYSTVGAQNGMLMITCNGTAVVV